MDKVISVKEAVSKIKDGATIMVGGFLGCGTPHHLINYLANETDLKDLTIIGNDTAYIDYGIGLLIKNKQVKHFIGSHIGTNKETGRQMNENETKVTLVPQGTLAERIRAGGYGLGGVLTGTGVGIPEIEEGKQIVEVQGKKYILEEPLHADFALLCGHEVDKYGNTKYRGSALNFNGVMAFAADTVIMEADHLVDIGEIDSNEMVTPGVVVDYIVEGSPLTNER